MKLVRSIGALAIAMAIGTAPQSAQAQKHGLAPRGHASAPQSDGTHRSNAAPRLNSQSSAIRQNAHSSSASNHQQNQQQSTPAHTNNSNAAPGHGNQPGTRNAFHPPAKPPQAGGSSSAGKIDSLPPRWAENLRDRSPEEQQRFMQNNARFKNLPPERQQQVRRNLEKWNSLSPTERNAIRDRQATWERMTPDQRQLVQKTLLPKWQAMTPGRKQVVTDRLHTLQGMAPADRQAALNDPKFMQGLNPDEQSVLRGLDSVRNPQN